jgi:hypothetical protein
MVHPFVSPDDVMNAAASCRAALAPALGDDWTVDAGDLEWDCRRTLDHISDSLFFYAASLATRATGRLSPPRNGDPTADPATLLSTVECAAAILAEVGRAAPPDTRAFHPAGMADVCGWMALGCEEILLHTADITQSLGLPYRPPNDLSARMLARLFPWAPSEIDPWDSLRWATGRAALPDRPRLGPDWYWHCAPLSEWDGTVKRRTTPPAWR